MKRLAASLLVFAVLLLSLSAALAQSVPCEAGRFTFELPDHFKAQKYSSKDDPDLCLYWAGKKVTVQAYAAKAGKKATLSDLFQVLTDPESETRPERIVLNGMEMLYITGTDSSGAYIMYTWLDRGTNVTLYFYYPEKDKSSVASIENIMKTIVFDASR